MDADSTAGSRVLPQRPVARFDMRTAALISAERPGPIEHLGKPMAWSGLA